MSENESNGTPGEAELSESSVSDIVVETKVEAPAAADPAAADPYLPGEDGIADAFRGYLAQARSEKAALASEHLAEIRLSISNAEDQGSLTAAVAEELRAEFADPAIAPVAAPVEPPAKRNPDLFPTIARMATMLSSRRVEKTEALDVDGRAWLITALYAGEADHPEGAEIIRGQLEPAFVALFRIESITSRVFDDCGRLRIEFVVVEG